MITPSPEASPVVEQATSTPMATVTQRPTFTPAPATPAPTATPTVTPTPIVYTVQPGDTLLAVAAQFGVSAQSIQEANGIIDPRRLQVGQPLIIPGPEEDSEQPPTPTPTPMPLSVQRLNFQQTPAGGLWALGEVYNPGGEPVAEVLVQVSLLDGQGQLLAVETGFLQLDVVPPASAVAFAILFAEPPSQFAQYQAVALTGVPLSPNARYYLDVAATDVRGETVGADTYRVTGQLRNLGVTDAERLNLLVTGYDNQERVTAVRQASLAASVLRASAITPFRVDLTIVGSPVVTYSVQAQALAVQ
jgi:LysM repeat protein